MKGAALRAALDPHPLRTLALKSVKRWEYGSYGFRVGVGAVDRPHYAYLVWEAARLARRLHIPRISVIEFGVAGGNGLLCLEKHAEATSAVLKVGIDVYGFDTGEGLPEPTDFRDLPYHWKQGFFNMDEAALRRRLKRANLIIGDIRDTIPSFIETYHPAPIGAVVQDLDLYSSTKVALTIFDVEDKYRMPRIFTYFDDIIGNEIALYNDYTGERLAIAEFNESHSSQKVAPAYYLLDRVREGWHHRMFVVHDFAHPRYNEFVSSEAQELFLKDSR
jgi:hypothetical protein